MDEQGTREGKQMNGETADNGKIVVITTFCPSEKNAEQIAEPLIRQAMAASVHIDKVRSIYRWERDVHDRTEYRLEAVCGKNHLREAVKIIEMYNSYYVPAVTWTETDATPRTAVWVHTGYGSVDKTR